MLTDSEMNVLQEAVTRLADSHDSLVALQDMLQSRGKNLNIDDFESDEQKAAFYTYNYGAFASLNGWLALIQSAGHQIGTVHQHLVSTRDGQRLQMGTVPDSPESKPTIISGHNPEYVKA